MMASVVLAQQQPGTASVLLPVVATQPGGKPVVDLTLANFSVEARRGVQLTGAAMVAAEAMNDPQHTFPVFIVYDAYLFPAPVQSTIANALLQFLGEVAQHYNPVTLVANTPSGIKLIYEFGTDPRVLTEALAALNNNSKPADAKVKEQLERLKLLRTYVPTPGSLDDQTILQFAGLNQVAPVLGRSPYRKALLWLTWNYRMGSAQNTATWTGSSSAPNKSLTMTTGSESEMYANSLPDARFQKLPPAYQKTIDSLNAAHVSVYALQQYDPNNASLSINDPVQQVTVDGLRQVAACTGGFSVKDYRHTTVAQAIEQVRADFGPYYMLTVTPGESKKTEWVPVTVKVNQETVTLRSAPGFLALSPSAEKLAAK